MSIKCKSLDVWRVCGVLLIIAVITVASQGGK